MKPKAVRIRRIRHSVARIKGMGSILWTAKHELFHIMLGFMWVWAMRERWQEMNPVWLWTAAFGSLLPDIDHFIYFFTYGKRDPYTRTIITFLKNKEWRILVKFIAKGHKYNTNLSFHNYYITAMLFIMCAMVYVLDWRSAVIFLGSMLTHYLYDILEDLLVLGHVNQNWKRWGRAKQSVVVGPPIDDIR